MIDGKLKKYAQEKGLSVDKGVAYGVLGGYACTLCYSDGALQLVVSTRFEAGSQQDALRAALEQRNVEKEFKVRRIHYAADGISVLVMDSFNTIKRLDDFLTVFLPMLEQYGASKANVCICCGMPLEEGTWVLREGVVACHVHSACADKILREVAESNEQRKSEGNGSYGKGFLGAFIGMLAGSVLWAVIYALGYVASLAGLAIGWLANLLYDKFGGKQGKGKIAILIILVILGVFLGTYAGITIGEMVYVMNEPEVGYTAGEVPMLVLMLMLFEPEFQLAMLKDVGLGLLFAALGVFALLRKASRQVADEKVTVLK